MCVCLTGRYPALAILIDFIYCSFHSPPTLLQGMRAASTSSNFTACVVVSQSAHEENIHQHFCFTALSLSLSRALSLSHVCWHTSVCLSVCLSICCLACLSSNVNNNSNNSYSLFCSAAVLIAFNYFVSQRYKLLPAKFVKLKCTQIQCLSICLSLSLSLFLSLLLSHSARLRLHLHG